MGKHSININDTNIILSALDRKIASHASKISLQQIFLPTILGWISKQRYLRRTTNKQILDTLLQNEAVYLDDIKELDQKLIYKPDEDDNEPIQLLPIAKKQKPFIRCKSC